LNQSLNIFFIETSGRSCLTGRQACGIESAARANPKAIITLYMEKNLIINLPKIDNAQKIKVECEITDAFFKQGAVYLNEKWVTKKICEVHSSD
jgi:lactosylceramide 4-alpha-galactosyltransferase